MSSEVAITVDGLSKAYHIYSKPRDRLKQMFFPRLQRIVGRPGKPYYREFWALRDVSFEVRRGETFGIIGRNGSGKSTLLQMICGILNPSHGTISANGRIAALLELGSGFNPDFTGRENVYMNAAVLGFSKDEIDARYDDILSFADIGEFADQPVKTYSSGMYVRLAFAVAINVEPQILIVDEALAVGDEPFQRKCYSRIERIRDSGATILLVTHGAETITQMCSRALVLDQGSRLFVGRPKTAVENYHRLLYAAPTDVGRIRHELRVLDALGEDGYTDAANPLAVPPLQESAHASDEEVSADSAGERFDPGLVPGSTMAYASDGARIENIRIENSQGKVVNVLAPGGVYFYCYEVDFDRAADCVHFGMLIKSINGTELGALGSHPLGDSMKHVRAGERCYVRFPFFNVFSPGTYFMNAGCSAALDGSDRFLHRIIDAIAFRVESTRAGLRYAGTIQISAGAPYVALSEDMAAGTVV